MQNPHLETLQKMQSILMQMHRLLMSSQKSDLEARTGQAINPTEWMRILMTSAEFAWMGSMLTLISDIDALMDNHEVTEKDLQVIRQVAEQLFLTGGESEFFSNYKSIAQKDPDVILYHGQLRASILALPASAGIEDSAAKDIRKNWHVKPKSFH